MKEENSCCRISVDSSLIENAKACLVKHKEGLSSQAQIFSLLGNEVRLKIIRLFLEFERMCVCDLADILAMNQSPISQHLRKLKDGGLLLNKREGMTIFYFINPRQKERLERLIKG
ncbi:winged helix-turn-helix transcriptional regulator [Sulfurimonas sediminis]|uniref:Winged helix-turn-helix transcriptional regulator n=1 Tax=Sulfurimonas sediminis TaxID=2590020 RepID=A0A7M1B495_9BACT|nr:metalloregulator ArsR/SmtB family transcription factor [Sulfurimonas sediminis]QOP44559.1 winged helix-turn-helix transcriptional regulator [Sulfurimonas sediminis]